MSILGKHVQLTLFGESHGKGVGGVIVGLPAGHEIIHTHIRDALNRRKSSGTYDTPRKEPDAYDILSGTYLGKTTGSPLAIWIENKDIKSDDYKNLPYRPGHGDYTAHIKYGGWEDPRGAGHMSGRLTAPLVAIGAIVQDILKTKGIDVHAELIELGGKKTESDIDTALKAAKDAGDSLGGKVRLEMTGVPVGVGDVRFKSLASSLAGALLGLGAVKAVTIGDEHPEKKTASEYNDAYGIKDGAVYTKTNHAGGILAGISTGGAIILTASIKPTPSIKKEQQTVTRDKQPTTLALKGRHDTAVARRIPQAIEAAAAVVILDALIDRFGELGMQS